MHHQLIDLERFHTPTESVEASPKVNRERALPRSLIEQAATTCVGHEPLADVLEAVKRSMLKAALWRTAGNFTHAASLLGVTRQAVQQMVARYELCGWVECVRQETDDEPRSTVTRSQPTLSTAASTSRPSARACMKYP